MSMTKKALFLWWGLAALLVAMLLVSWQFEAIRPTGGLRDMGVLVVLLVSWGYVLYRLTSAHKDSKSVGAAK